MIKNEYVKKSYQMDEIDLTVVKDLNISIEHGESVAIVGLSGSGNKQSEFGGKREEDFLWLKPTWLF